MDRLEKEIEDLRQEIYSLRGSLRRLERLVERSGLDLSDSASAIPTVHRVELSAASSVGSYSFVDSASVVGGTPYPSGEAAGNQAVAVCSLSWAERQAICEQIGRFLRKALAGEWHGSSGRDRINIPSTIWLVFQDYYRQVHNPVLVFRNWSSCRDLVKRAGNQCGKSIFIGLPTEIEAKLVTSLAGVSWPAPTSQ